MPKSPVPTSGWGGRTSAGALQRAIDTIGAAPLSVTSYATAVSTLVTAAIQTVTKTAGISAQKLARIPFTLAGDLATAGAGAINAFINGTAGVVAGLLQLQVAGVPSLLHDVSYGVAAFAVAAFAVAAFAVAVNNWLASGITYALDTVATKVAQALGAPVPSTGKTSSATAVSASASVTDPAASTSSATVPKTTVKVAAARAERVRKPVAAADSDDGTSETGSSGSANSSSEQSDGSDTARTPRKRGRHSAGAHPSASSSKAGSPSISAIGRHGSVQQGRRHRS